uniref:tyrosinase n=1 Tax=Psilocybe cubensis TaxID=181762 RepID=A0A8H7Y6A8_PSICU
MANRVVVQGAQPRPPPGQFTHPRLEISTFVQNLRQFSLYVQALQIFYDRYQGDATSYWQISGIHGLPYVDWNGTPSGGRGYCVHQSLLFPTWHRPYVVLFEQEIQKIARELAQAYTHNRPLWEEAAAALRQPYWGWDNTATMVPPLHITTYPTLMIVKARSTAFVRVPNPFLTYTYPKNGNAGFPPDFNVWPRTTRYPDASGNSQPDKLRNVLSIVGPQIHENFRRLFSLRTWKEFTSGGLGTSGLEAIHGTIHVRTGGPGGNMGQVPVADLLPFRRTQTDYWKSPDIIRTGDVFNYSYDRTVNASQSESSEGVATSDENTDPERTELEWSVRVECKQYEVGGSFSVYVFISNETPTNHHVEWLSHETVAGTFDVFANLNPEECANCSARVDQEVKGFVHINQKYLERSNATLSPEDVIPYLKENISWAVVSANGEVVDLQKFPSLKVTVISTPLTLSEGAKYPTEGLPTHYPEVTRGRLGGHRDD